MYCRPVGVVHRNVPVGELLDRPPRILLQPMIVSAFRTRVAQARPPPDVPILHHVQLGTTMRSDLSTALGMQSVAQEESPVTPRRRVTGTLRSQTPTRV